MERLPAAKKPEKRDAPPTIQISNEAASRDWLVALSGGRDSVALLHLLINARNAGLGALRAVHVHHGLSPNADHWATFCESLCERWDVPLVIEHVAVQIKPRLSVEAQARDARYAALLRTCRANEVVVLAHHADDQIESFFLQLLRGAGTRGLACMPAFAPASAQRPPLWRPLLATTRAQIDAYVQRHRLAHIEDESNRNTRFKRNALRADVLPMIERHFPAYRQALLRAIDHQQTMLTMLDEHTVQAARSDTLALTVLKTGSSAQACERLRRWLQYNGLPLPPATRTREAVRQLREISHDQRFRLQLGDGWVLYVKRGELRFEKFAP